MEREKELTKSLKRSHRAIKDYVADFDMTGEALAHVLIRRVRVLSGGIRIHKTNTGSENTARKFTCKILCEILFSAPIAASTKCGHLDSIIDQFMPVRWMVLLQIDIFAAIPVVRFTLLLNAVVLLHEEHH